jgi:hypothetical protein
MLAKFKIYIVMALTILSLLSTTAYLNNRLETKKEELKTANKNLELATVAYELSLKIEAETSYAKGLSEQSKKQVIKKQTRLKKAIKKRGKIKNEKDSDFIVFTF